VKHISPRTHERALVILRNALERLELDQANIDTPTRADLKRVLLIRIANLEADSVARDHILGISGNHSAPTRR
jgi:hypothetical protein